MYLTLFTDNTGNVREHRQLKMLGQTGSGWVEPMSVEMMPLPKGASLVLMPGHIPVGIKSDRPVPLTGSRHNQGQYSAVAALLPQGFTRTLLPAAVATDHNDLPLLGYTAVGLRDEQIYVAAIKTDEHRKWHPKNYNTERLPEKITAFLKRYPHNRIIRQLANCALEYSCFTAQNLFYRRWEAGIPTSKPCNANCIGCISESHTSAFSAQNRLEFSPETGEIVELGAAHLAAAKEAIISFGQGCEGEPSLNADKIGAAIRIIRQQTDKGTINMNTNAGFTEGIRKLCDAGLDSIRVTMFSPLQEDYNYYHRPQNYRFSNVLKSIHYASDHQVKVSINLLTYPGFTDRPEQVEPLLKLIHKTKIDMIQLRNLNIDPKYMLPLKTVSEPLGIPQFIKVIKQEAPGITVGSYSRPVR